MLSLSALVTSADHRLLQPLSSSVSSLSSKNPNFSIHFSTERRHLPSLSLASPLVACSVSAKRFDGDASVIDSVDGDKKAVGEFVVETEETAGLSDRGDETRMLSVGIGNPSFIGKIGFFRMSLGDQAFFLLSFIALTTSVAFASLVAATVPTLFAMNRAAKSLSRLADAAREELPSTMAAIRLSGMEISDLTLELSDLSQEIAEGVSKSAQVVRAAEAGIKQMGALAHEKTMSMIEERANLPEISIQPLVVGAARKTSRAVGRAKKSLMNFISQGESDGEERERTDRVES